MTGIAVVASASDAKFAESVCAALQASGLDASVSQSLPKAAGPHVVLIWSAALEAGHAIDAQALIGLWSEDRLVTVRRDATPLPLGLRDLPSLGIETSAEEVAAAARAMTAGRDAQVLVGSMPDLGAAPRAVATKAEVARPEAGLKEKHAEAPREKKTMGVVIGALVVFVIVGGGGWYYFNKANLEKQAALTAALETATKASQELQQAQAKQIESLKALEQARAGEIDARKAGDPAKLKEAQEAAKRAEAEAAKQAEAVKQREAAASDARKKAQDSSATAKKAVAKAAAPEKKEEFPAPAVVAEAPKAEVPQSGTATAQFEPAAKAEAPKAAAKAPMSRSEREREEEDRLASQAVLKKGVPVAAAPAATTAAEAQAPSAPDVDALYQQAVAMEKAGKGSESIRIYRRAARAGSGKAAKRLGEIYDRGIAGVSRDYAESLQWYETARQLGERIETQGSRGGPEAPVVAAPAPAPAVREPVKAAPLPAVKSAPAPEPVKAAEPAPVPAPAPTAEPPKAAAPVPTAAPAPEAKPGWFSIRGLLIALLVLGLIAWRRVRRREKALARQSRSQSGAASDGSPAQAAVLIAALSESAKLDRAAVDECLRAVRKCTEAAKGRVVRTKGDEVVASFPGTDAAADAAIEIQIDIDALKPADGQKFGLRIGVCHGPISIEADGNIYGEAVNVASRLSQVAVKGQILAARDTVKQMSPMLKSAARKITTIQVKGRAAEVEVYELMWRQSEDAATMGAAREGYRPKKAAVRLVLRGQEHLLSSDERITASIGSDAGADLVVKDPLVSPMHCRIERRLDKFVLIDLSDNGTYVMVDGDKEIVLRREEFTLRGRGWISFGQSKTTATDVLEYFSDGAPPVARPDASLFVSYSHKDRNRVEPIVSVIEEMGRRVWMDRTDITGQTGWAGQIVRAIRECRAVVLMASPNSYTSDQVVRELYLAMNHRKTIVPIEIEPAEMPDELQYILAPFQHHRLSAGETRAVLGRALAAV